MVFFLIWIGSIVATASLAARKNLSIVGFIFLSIFFGPLALLIVLLMPTPQSKKEREQGPASLRNAQGELASIKDQLFSLQKRIGDLEGVLKAQAVQPSLIPQGQAISEEEKERARETKEGFEFVFGRYWLNRIGVVVFFLGVAFFIGYTFKYLNAFANIIIGYVFSAVFFAWGNFLEKRRKYVRISWGILAGAWGLLYLSTYAMHYIEATRIISSPALELWLLAIASAVTIAYNLRYRSWVVTALTFTMAFITAGLGGIDYSTIIYCTLLIASATFISYRLNWHKFLIFVICGTYLTYMYWLYPQIFSASLFSMRFSLAVYQFHLTFGILSISWVLFTLGLFLLHGEDKAKLKYMVAGTLLNLGFFVCLGLSELYRVRPHLGMAWDVRFWYLAGLSGIYFLSAYINSRLKRTRLIVVNSCLAFSLLASAIMVRFPSLSVAFFWILEMVIIFFMGFYYREWLYRVAAYILGSLILFRLFIVDYFSGRYYAIFGIELKHNILIFAFAAFIFYLLGTWAKRQKNKESLIEGEGIIFDACIVFGSALLTFLFAREVKQRWHSSVWALEGIAILGTGFLLRQKIYRICALCVLSLACLRLVFVDLAQVDTIYRIVAFLFLGAILLGASLAYSKFTILGTKKGR